MTCTTMLQRFGFQSFSLGKQVFLAARQLLWEGLWIESRTVRVMLLQGVTARASSSIWDLRAWGMEYRPT